MGKEHSAKRKKEHRSWHFALGSLLLALYYALHSFTADRRVSSLGSAARACFVSELLGWLPTKTGGS